MDQPTERDPLLVPLPLGSSNSSELGDHHSQFCRLVGVRPLNDAGHEPHKPHPQSLYARVLKQRRDSACAYMFTATLVNTLLLTQIVLGAALTGLAAGNSSRILITTFGALNTIIAGVVAFLKSRGQPLRSRMFRDDLSRVVDEIENSAIMWYGISASAHGYDAIDTDEQVTVRSEVARLTRLYDKAVKTNTMNDPDMYAAGTGDSYNAGLRKFVGAGAGAGAVAPNGVLVAAPVAVPPVQSPAASPTLVQDETKPQEAKDMPAVKPTEEGQAGSSEDAAQDQEVATMSAPSKPGSLAAASTSVSGAQGKGRDASQTQTSSSSTTASKSVDKSAGEMDPDASPASAARLPKKEDTSKSDHTLVENSDL